MSVKIISKSVKICSGIIFAMCFKVKIFLFFVEFFSEQISIVLIILATKVNLIALACTKFKVLFSKK